MEKIKLTLSIALLLVLSCAHAPAKPVDLFWPLPPQEPRIKFLETIATKRDLGLSGWERFLDVIFGVDTGLRPLKPWGVTADDEGRMYVTDTAGAVFVYDKRAKKVWLMGTSGRGGLSLPLGIAWDGMGKIWVADGLQRRVLAFDREGELKLALGQGGEFGKPAGVAVNRKVKRLYVSDTGLHKVRVYDLEGKFLFEFGKRGDMQGEFNYPASIAADSERVYVTDQMNFRVQVFDKDGKALLAFGMPGDRPGFFARPKGIAADSEGHIYIVDAAFDNFQIFDKDGHILMSVGHGGGGAGEFSLPAGISIDDEDKIYVVEQLTRRVQIFQYLGEKYRAKTR